MNQDFTGYTKPNVLRYAFVAPGPSITYTFTPANPQNGFHQYAFTNEVAVPEPAGVFAFVVGGLALLARRQ